MQNILLMMHRQSVAQGLMHRLSKNPDVRFFYEPNYNQVEKTLHQCNAKTLLLEATETLSHNTAYCLSLCKDLRKHFPDCKLLLMCPEQEDESINQVVLAKGRKEIDDFVFYDVTIDYLVEKLLSM